MEAAASTWVHPFERAGFGRAPYRCTGYQELVWVGPDGYTKAGGSCDVCGTSIRHSYTITSTDGVAFKVGCDCVQKTGDTELIASMRREEKAAKRAYERSLWEAARPEREARERAESELRAKVAAANVIDHALTLHACAVVLADARTSEWTASRVKVIVAALTEGQRDGLTDAEVDILGEAWLTASLPVSSHFGGVGARVRNLDVIYLGGPVFESAYGIKRLANFAVVGTGEILVWGTTSGIGFWEEDGHYHGFDKGDRLRIVAATIKGHGEYKSTKQTSITRAKLAAHGGE